MKTRNLVVTVVGVFCFWLGGTAIAHAQCQDQICQAPSSSGNPNCYTCTSTGGSGSSCSLSGSCPQSCSTGSCTPSTPECDLNPVAEGCPNPCNEGTGATTGCGTEIVCDGSTVTSCSGSGTGGNPGNPGGCITDCGALLDRRFLLKDVAALLPKQPAKQPASSCQTVDLPKNVLFSL